jgi:hypothetical protein
MQCFSCKKKKGYEHTQDVLSSFNDSLNNVTYNMKRSSSVNDISLLMHPNAK